MSFSLSKRLLWLFALLTGVSLIFPSRACATDQGNDSNNLSKDLPKLLVTSAKNAATGRPIIGLGDVLEVNVRGLDDYLKGKRPDTLNQFVLFLDTRPFPSLSPRRVTISRVPGADDKNTNFEKDTLRFDLKLVSRPKGAPTQANDPSEKKSNEASWHALLGSPDERPGESKAVRVSIGLDNMPVASDAVIDFVTLERGWAVVSFFIVLAITVSLIVLGVFTDLLRDGGAEPNGGGAAAMKTYSLGRVQAAIWFWTVLLSFVFIWSVTGDTGTITGQILGILGLSTMTFVGAIAVDSRNNSINSAPIDELKRQQAENQKRIDLIKSLPTPLTPAVQAESLALAAAQLKLAADITNANTSVVNARQSKGFIKDILTDDHGISFHRFQFFAWTLVLVMVFLQQVWQQLSMPVLDEYLLTLMGISSGTYVGVKNTEANPPKV